MKKLIASLLTLTLAGVAITTTTEARAQQVTSPSESQTWLRDRVPAPTNAFELTLGTGYTQGLGMIRGGASVPSVATPGMGFDLAGHWRLDERFSIGLGGQYQELFAPNGAGARGLTSTIALAYHLNPELRVDPWLEIGTGYRMLWEDKTSGPNVLRHGFELARARVGADFRVSPELAIGPVIGADMNMFLWENARTSETITDVRLNTFLFAGIQGRMDIGGSLVGRATLTSTSPTEP